MFASLLTLALVPTLFLSATATPDTDHEQIAIDTCISAVQIHFPCQSSAPANYNCLCEQQFYQVACYNNHGYTSYSNHGRMAAEVDMHRYCREAGSFGKAIIKQQPQLQRRQLDSFFGGVASFFSSLVDPHTADPGRETKTQTPAKATAKETSAAQQSSKPAPATSTPPPPPPASSSAPPPKTSDNTPTSATPSPTSAAAKTTDKPSTHSNQQTSTSTTDSTSTFVPTEALPAPTSSSTAAPAKSSSSGAMIAGAVIGTIAGISFLGLLVIFLLRFRKQRPAKNPFAPGAEDDRAALHRKALSVETLQRQSNNMTIDDDKDIYYMHEQTPTQPRGDEMTSHGPTMAWELDSIERPAPVELEAPDSYVARVARVSPVREISEPVQVHAVSPIHAISEPVHAISEPPEAQAAPSPIPAILRAGGGPARTQG